MTLAEKKQNHRLLILVVAYNAEKTIQQVLRRIPQDYWRDGVEVLVIDDFSTDETFRAGREFEQNYQGGRLRVLRTPENQGYGGNQKLGYRYAIDHGFDYVALVHGDGQYAPEKLPELLAPLLADEADAVFGSRMMTRGAALKGRMPLYKYIGNKILSSVENAILRTHLTEFHSGYRVYAVNALKKIPFERNTNDFHFDTEIIIQLLLAEQRIKEVPIPTYYGDEICHVNGLKYAWDVFKAVLRVRFHNMSLLYDRKFDVAPAEARYGLKLSYESSHTAAIGSVHPGERILDIGCGQGLVAHELQQMGCEVTGIDQYADADKAQEKGLQLLQADLDNQKLPVDASQFECVLMLDIIEHLKDPESFMEMLRYELAGSRARLILTTANIGFFSIRLGLMLGQFNYGRKGILDRTHTRLFTFRTLRALLEQSGFTVEQMRGIPAPFPEAIGLNWASRLLLFFNSIAIRVLPGLFSYQIFVSAKARPTVSRLLLETEETSSKLVADATQ